MTRALLFLLLAGCVDFDRDGWSVPSDCDDANAGIHPGADEICDAAQVDEDCDGKVNDDDDVALAVLFLDQDGDGQGDPRTAHLAESCVAALGMVSDGSDCDDEEAQVHVGATEVCDGRDNDCDGRVDDDDDVVDPETQTTWYADEDGDGYGGPDRSAAACSPPLHFVETSSDCDDADPAVSPAAVEVCDNDTDDNCDGSPEPCGLSGSLATDAIQLSSTSATGIERVGAAEDLDGDGWPDLVAGAPSTGRAWAWFGPFRSSEVSRLPDRPLGGVEGSAFGAAVLGGRDLTGDGRVDVVVGDPLDTRAGVDAGAVHVFAGPISPGDALWDGAGAVILGPAPETRAGGALAWAGDTDGDGAQDLLVGASENPLQGGAYGSAYLLRGPVRAEVDLAWADGIYLGAGPDDRLGAAVAGVGDVDGDGLDDVLIGAPGSTTGVARGTTWLLLGPAEQAIEDADLRIVAAEAGTGYGRALTGADFDGDGHSDFVVAAPTLAPAGAVYVYDGADWPTEPEAAVATIAGTREGLRTGASLATLGDTNGDAVPDLAVGVPRSPSDTEDALTAGAVSVFYGPVRGTLTGFDDAAGRLVGDHPTQGAEVRAGGDLDRNGLADLLSFDMAPPQGSAPDTTWIALGVGE